MKLNKIDYSQYPDKSIPIYYSTPKGYLTYTGQIIPKHLSQKVYLMPVHQASEVLDLTPYQEYLNGDITKEDKFIHREWGKKINFTKLNRAIASYLKDDPSTDIVSLFNKLLINYPFTVKDKPKKVIQQEKIEQRFKTELAYRFDLDYQ